MASPSSFGRPIAVALPERDRAGQPRRRRDDHAVAADLLDPPGARPEQERLAGAGLVDHLLVELAHPAPVGQRDRVQAAVGDRAGVGDRELPRARARPDRTVDAVPDDPRAQLGELRTRVAAVEHVEHVLELGRGVSSAYECVRVTSACSSSTLTGRSSGAAAAIATICCASTSSAFRGTTVVSIRPSRIRCATTAHSSRSARNLGKMRPRLTSPTEWPARPIRWSPRATDFGDSTWITRSTAPMSIPSSRDDVATRHGSSPAFSISSTTSRSSRARDPWWARAISCSAQLIQPQRQPLGRAAVVDEQDRRAVRLNELEQLGVDRRPDRATRRLGPPTSGSRSGAGVASGSTIESTGTLISRSSSLRIPVSTIRHSRVVRP